MQACSAIRPVVAALLLAGAPALAQTTWYVDAQATPPGLGTPASPYASIQHAHDQPATVHGDQLLVAPGVYAEDLNLHKHLHILASGGPGETELRPTQVITLYHVSPGLNPLVLEGFSIVAHAAWPDFATIDISQSTLRRCVVRDNTDKVGVSVNVVGWIESCVITANEVGVSMGGFDFATYLQDSIVYGNGEDLDLGAEDSEVRYCAGLAVVTGTFASVGNVIGDPEVWDLDGGDYHLKPGSPCIDAGDPLAPLDPDGTRTDIGLFAYDPTYAPGPASYCTGKLNSQGCVPAIGWIGSASATAPAPFSITASDVATDKSGFLFFGFGAQEKPFQGGLKCVQPPTKRVGVQDSGNAGAPCTGAYAFDMGGYIQSGAHAGLVPGATAYCQWWGRDPADPSGFGTSLSDAAWFGIAP